MGANFFMSDNIISYFNNISNGIKSLISGLSLTWEHMVNKEERVATLQYPHEKFPVPEKNIGFEQSEYNVIRSRLHVDIDDCIGCLQCERACPVDCIKIDTIKPPKGNEFECGTTSNDTKKKMIVPRFTIDMSECMYCNLCVYPCPEECIYMVGGPNESKHEIDYEFSQYKRDGMIFEFSNVTKEDIVNIGGESYLEQKKMKQEKVIEGERLLGIKEKAPLKKVIINPVSVVPTTATAVQQVSNFSPKSLSEIEDPVIRGTAKKIFMASKKAGDDDNTKIDKIIEGIKELDGFTAELEQKLLSLKMTAAPEVVAAVPTLDSAIIEENETAPISKPILELFSIKKINDIEDPIVRGTLKKVYMAGKKEKLLNQEMVDKMKNELESKKLLDQTLIKFLEMLGK
jgi:formate hydrogenlyase subunit 6/NADH:ubiquinone oxidoreductase subunit I